MAQGTFPAYQNRVLSLSLTPDNMDRLEAMSFEETIAQLEQMDDEYYRVVPSPEELVKRYGDPAGEAFYSERDLYLRYQRRYIAEHQLDVYDIHDERQHFSRRF